MRIPHKGRSRCTTGCSRVEYKACVYSDCDMKHAKHTMETRKGRIGYWRDVWETWKCPIEHAKEESDGKHVNKHADRTVTNEKHNRMLTRRRYSKMQKNVRM